MLDFRLLSTVTLGFHIPAPEYPLRVGVQLTVSLVHRSSVPRNLYSGGREPHRGLPLTGEMETGRM